MVDHPQQPSLLTTREVAELFRVSVATVTSWAEAGRLACIRTPGGQRRFRSSDLDAFLAVDGAA